MNQEIIEVLLTSEDADTDALIFKIDGNQLMVNLNSPDCQSAFKNIFAELLRKLVKDDIVLELNIDEGFNRVLYKEVCEEYIKDLNRELNECKDDLRKQLSQGIGQLPTPFFKNGLFTRFPGPDKLYTKSNVRFGTQRVLRASGTR